MHYFEGNWLETHYWVWSTKNHSSSHASPSFLNWSSAAAPLIMFCLISCPEISKWPRKWRKEDHVIKAMAPAFAFLLCWQVLGKKKKRHRLSFKLNITNKQTKKNQNQIQVSGLRGNKRVDKNSKWTELLKVTVFYTYSTSKQLYHVTTFLWIRTNSLLTPNKKFFILNLSQRQMLSHTWKCVLGPQSICFMPSFKVLILSSCLLFEAYTVAEKSIIVFCLFDSFK